MNKVIGYSAVLSVASLVAATSCVNYRRYYGDCLESNTNAEMLLNLSKSIACGTIFYSTVCGSLKIVELATETLNLN
jgi:hypothetical protein